MIKNTHVLTIKLKNQYVEPYSTRNQMDNSSQFSYPTPIIFMFTWKQSRWVFMPQVLKIKVSDSLNKLLAWILHSNWTVLISPFVCTSVKNIHVIEKVQLRCAIYISNQTCKTICPFSVDVPFSPLFIFQSDSLLAAQMILLFQMVFLCIKQLHLSKQSNKLYTAWQA